MRPGDDARNSCGCNQQLRYFGRTSDRTMYTVHGAALDFAATLSTKRCAKPFFQRRPLVVRENEHRGADGEERSAPSSGSAIRQPDPNAGMQ